MYLNTVEDLVVDKNKYFSACSQRPQSGYLIFKSWGKIPDRNFIARRQGYGFKSQWQQIFFSHEITLRVDLYNHMELEFLHYLCELNKELNVLSVYMWLKYPYFE